MLVDALPFAATFAAGGCACFMVLRHRLVRADMRADLANQGSAVWHRMWQEMSTRTHRAECLVDELRAKLAAGGKAAHRNSRDRVLAKAGEIAALPPQPLISREEIARDVADRRCALKSSNPLDARGPSAPSHTDGRAA